MIIHAETKGRARDFESVTDEHKIRSSRFQEKYDAISEDGEML
jgi:hypothetical protein